MILAGTEEEKDKKKEKKKTLVRMMPECFVSDISCKVTFHVTFVFKVAVSSIRSVYNYWQFTETLIINQLIKTDCLRHLFLK